MQKKLFCLVPLLALFSLTSCDEIIQNNNNIIIEETNEENDDKKKVYEEIKEVMDYDTFLEKLHIRNDNKYTIYTIDESDLFFVMICKDDEKYVTFKSIDGNTNNINCYRYDNSNPICVGKIDIENEKTIIELISNDYIFLDLDESKYNEDTFPNLLSSMIHLFSDYSCQEMNSYIEKTNEFNLENYSVDIILKRWNREVTKSEYVYNNDNLVSYTEYDVVNKEYKITKKDEFIYDENGNKIGEKKYKLINKELVLFYETGTLDNVTQKKDITFENEINGVYTEKYEFTYIDEKEVSRINYIYSDNKWVPTKKYENTYENGNQLECIYSVYKDEEWIFKDKSTYEYDETGTRITINSFRYLDNEWVVNAKEIRINSRWYYQTIVDIINNELSKKTESTYDEKGNVLTKLISKFENDNWILHHKYVYTYNENGACIEENDYVYKRNEWHLFQKSINQNNKWLIKEYYIYNEDGSMYSKYEYSYDENDTCITTSKSDYENDLLVEIEDLINNEWKDRVLFIQEDGKYLFKFVYTYIDNGCITIQSYYDDNNEWVLNSKEENIYNENGSFLSQTTSFRENDDWALESKVEYTYDNDRHTETITISKYIDGKWINTSKKRLINGNMLQELSVSLKNGKLDIKTEYTYDENGTLITQEESEYIDNDWLVVSRKNLINGQMCLEFRIATRKGEIVGKDEYTYDTEGNRITTISSKYIDNKWIEVQRETLINGSMHRLLSISLDSNDKYIEKTESEYDENGNNTSKTISNYVNDGWVLDTKTKYTYDENNTLVFEEESKYIDNKWILTSKKGLFNHKMLIEYSLTFKNGKMYEKLEQEWNDHGYRLSTMRYRYIDNDWVLVQQLKWIKGSERVLLNTTYNSKDEFDTKTESEYDENGNLLRRLDSKYIDGEWLPVFMQDSVNDTSFNVILVDGKPSEKYEYENLYSEDGKTEITRISHYENKIWVYYSKTEKIYDKNYNHILTMKYIYENNDWVNSKKEEYIYAENGALSKMITSNYMDGSWKYHMKEEYSYDDTNGCTTTFYIFMSGEWVEV